MCLMRGREVTNNKIVGKFYSISIVGWLMPPCNHNNTELANILSLRNQSLQQ
jgi:hypothetical protein